MHGNSHETFRHPAANRMAKTLSERTGLQTDCCGIAKQRWQQWGAAFCGNCRHGLRKMIFSTRHGEDRDIPENNSPLGRR